MFLSDSFLLVLTLSLPPCSSLTQDVRTTGLKNQALYAADPFTVMAGAERGKKGNIFFVTVVEMQQIAGASKYFRVIN